MTRVGRAICLIGAVLTLIVGAAGWWGAAQGLSSLRDGGADVALHSGHDATVPMEVGDWRLILAESSEAISCTVTGPDERELALDAQGSLTISGQQGSMELIGRISATQTGDHHITCEGGSTLITPAFNSGNLLSFTLVAFAGLALIPLVLLTLLGLLFWVVGATRDRRRRAAAARAAFAGAPGGYPGEYAPQDTAYPHYGEEPIDPYAPPRQ